MTIESPVQPTRFKLGASPFWLDFDQEEMGSVSSWNMSIRYVPRRTKMKQTGPMLLEVTPRKPILSIILSGETYPLFITHWSKGRGQRFTIGGVRALHGPERIVRWSAEMAAVVHADRVQFGVTLEIRVTPKPCSPIRVLFDLSLPFVDPLVASSELAEVREERALVAWDLDSRNAVSYVVPSRALHGETWNDEGSFRSTFTDSIIGARKKLDLTFCVAHAETGPAVKEILLAHYASVQSAKLPPEAPWIATLAQTAGQAVVSHTDKGAFEVRGMERAYFLPPGVGDEGRPLVSEYYSGYPYFHADASLSLLEWNRFAGDEAVARIAKLTARGIAADFPAAMSSASGDTNKGAIWDKYACAGDPRNGMFRGFDDHPAFTLLTNARVARSLFEIHRHTGEDLFMSMALNTARWLLLRQNGSGYYGGDRYSVSGQWTGGNVLAGVETIPAFVDAFRATRNEVFIRAAWRVANFVIEEILPHHPAPPVLPMERGAPIDSAVALAAIIRAFVTLDAEAANKKLRAAIHLAGNRLICYPFERTRDPEFDYDEAWGGLAECAQAMFWLYNLEKRPEQLRVALGLLRAMPESSRAGWRSITNYLTAMLTVSGLVKGSKVNFNDTTVKIGWREFKPDSAARQYVSVEAADGDALIDHLALVCGGDNSSLVSVLSDRPVSSVTIIKNNRRPVVRDLVSGQLVAGDIPMHTLPFTSTLRFGVYLITV
ncbi:MAG: hypothetical protein P4L33_15660 [Capsulimonadaceae bacterium]|nr:hypothetical protein [Capsulimonadaceae bacterium]